MYISKAQMVVALGWLTGGRALDADTQRSIHLKPLLAVSTNTNTIPKGECVAFPSGWYGAGVPSGCHPLQGDQKVEVRDAQCVVECWADVGV